MNFTEVLAARWTWTVFVYNICCLTYAEVIPFFCQRIHVQLCTDNGGTYMPGHSGQFAIAL